MKSEALFLLAGSCLLAACHGPAHGQAQQTATAIQQAMQANRPGWLAASESGYVLRATIDGKPWKAASMMELNASNDSFVQGTGGDVTMGFYIDAEHPYLGRERPLGEGHSVDLTIGDGSWHAINGGYTIDKADPTLIEGRFHFTARKFQSEQTLEVSGGVFRLVPNRN